MNNCRVSVIIPTRNRLEKLRRALHSVDQQTFRDYEVLLVDDGSTDGTGEFLESGALVQEYPNIPSIRILINSESRGAAAARNQALAQSAGELIAFLDDDDVWLPSYLEQQSGRLLDNPDTACCARHEEFDASGQAWLPDSRPLLEYDQPVTRLLAESYIHSMSVFVCRKEAFDSVGLLNEELRIVHDWEWYARLLLSGGSILPPEGVVRVRREVPGGLVKHHREWHREEIQVLDRYLCPRAASTKQRRHVGAHRALQFARIGVSNKDYFFALRRMTEACWSAPFHTARIIVLRMRRNYEQDFR